LKMAAVKLASTRPATLRMKPMLSRQMFHWIKEQWLRLELRHQQWKYHRHLASLLPSSDVERYAAGRGFNLQLVKACQHELRDRQWTG